MLGTAHSCDSFCLMVLQSILTMKTNWLSSNTEISWASWYQDVRWFGGWQYAKGQESRILTCLDPVQAVSLLPITVFLILYPEGQNNKRKAFMYSSPSLLGNGQSEVHECWREERRALLLLRSPERFFQMVSSVHTKETRGSVSHHVPSGVSQRCRNSGLPGWIWWSNIIIVIR